MIFDANGSGGKEVDDEKRTLKPKAARIKEPATNGGKEADVEEDDSRPDLARLISHKEC